MYATAQKEEFSVAYLHAVASVAGFGVGSWRVDDDSVDMLIAAKGLVGTVRSPRLEIQLKCTQNLSSSGGSWSFQLDRKNYDELIPTDLHVPRILVVLQVPAAPDDWIVHGPNEMTLHRRAYWTSLKGLPGLPEGQNSKTVTLPHQNVFDVDGLRNVIELIGQKVL